MNELKSVPDLRRDLSLKNKGILVLLFFLSLALLAFGSSGLVGSAIVLSHGRFRILNLCALLLSIACAGAGLYLLFFVSKLHRLREGSRAVIVAVWAFALVISFALAMSQALELWKYTGARDNLAEVMMPRWPRSYVGMGTIEWGAPAWARHFVSHQKVFRRIDADENGLKDYWTADVAGFYALEVGRGYKLKFTDVATARADKAPVRDAYSWVPPPEPVPRAGYFLMAMQSDAEGTPYRQDPDGDGKNYTNLTTFAICVFPARYKIDGVRTFIVNEQGVVYWKDIGSKPIDQWPGPDPKALGWKAWDPKSRPGVF